MKPSCATWSRGTATPRCVLTAPLELSRPRQRTTPKALQPDAASVLETRAQLISAGIAEAHVDAILSNFIPSKSNVATKEDIKELQQDIKELQQGQQGIKEDIKELQQGQKGIKEDIKELQQGQQGIKEDIKELQQGQKELQQGQKELQQGQTELQQGQKELRLYLIFVLVLITLNVTPDSPLASMAAALFKVFKL